MSNRRGRKGSGENAGAETREPQRSTKERIGEHFAEGVQPESSIINHKHVIPAEAGIINEGPPAYSLSPIALLSVGYPQVAVVLQRLAVVREDEGKLAVIEGRIAPMNRHVVARAQKHHVLNAILADPADPVQPTGSPQAESHGAPDCPGSGEIRHPCPSPAGSCPVANSTATAR